MMTGPRILIAGIGNIFLGDDAFGVEVLRKLLERPQEGDVRAVDFGIRGFDLACAIMDGYEAVILVDALSRGGAPGTLYVIEPDVDALVAEGDCAEIGGHSLTPAHLLRFVQSLEGCIPRLYIVGCEPLSFGSEDEPQAGLSPAVDEAVERAVELIESLIGDMIAGSFP